MVKTQRKSAKKRARTTRTMRSAASSVRKKRTKTRTKKKVARKTLRTRKKRPKTQTWKEGDRTGLKLRGLRFPLALDRRINRAIKKQGTDRTSLVKEALEKYLDRLEGKTRRRAKKTRRTS